MKHKIENTPDHPQNLNQKIVKKLCFVVGLHVSYNET